jgi:hypothetical protein
MTSCNKTPTADPLSMSWVVRLFAKLHARYGHRWMSAYPAGVALDLAMAEWADGLAGCSGEEIKAGLAAWQDPWPPSLPEFHLACRPKNTRPPGWDRLLPALPRPAADPAVRLAAITEMRRIQGRG